MSPEPIMAYAQLNARIEPMMRGELFEDPLQEALEENGLGEVTGGGTMQAENGEIEFCGIDVDLFDLEQGAAFVCQYLSELGAPKGSKLQYTIDDQDFEIEFGELEGLAIYFNGTDLPDEVYANCDINDVYDELNRLLDERGSIQGHWQGPTETALYLYGVDVKEMQSLIADYMATYPLCQKARQVQIA